MYVFMWARFDRGVRQGLSRWGSRGRHWKIATCGSMSESTRATWAASIARASWSPAPPLPLLRLFTPAHPQGSRGMRSIPKRGSRGRRGEVLLPLSSGGRGDVTNPAGRGSSHQASRMVCDWWHVTGVQGRSDPAQRRHPTTGVRATEGCGACVGNCFFLGGKGGAGSRADIRGLHLET